MSGSDSDSDCGLVRVNSVKKNDEYMESPRYIEFKIKFKDTSDAKLAGLIYKLKKGQELPYEPDLSGKKFLILCSFKFLLNRISDQSPDPFWNEPGAKLGRLDWGEYWKVLDIHK